MLLALGLFPFTIETLVYDELCRKTAYRFALVPRVGTRDAAQFTGIGDEVVSLSGSAFDELSDGGASLDRLRDMAATGQTWPLVDGTGIVWGAFTIQSVDEKRRFFFPDGTPRQIDFGIELLRVDDGGSPA